MKTFLAFLILVLGVATLPLRAQLLPEICSKKNCFMAFDGSDRSFCQAYVEGKSCFMALNGQARSDCEANRVPREHRHWQRLCSS
ncbi:hypothetical protein [Ancylobacter pratisalsi]|uniref:Uncharacterized protein n=1 Tax=Ancylobacter pratisalsi TaxID=1745854 RepID=A0A6P1YRE2_9HYPH|nr:hypothetical protein [Ancylobacter pratisalsi]QIB35949.1 hypothetical protein G3A50_21225 [Ancylobacter pratisalsi]